ncbi:pyridoxamine 5'-phosphate oxidase family protein [Naasia sp. SYSU D00948]|uniref:pyridoxamine 5'-phosphate oxidase family protein n=1 Tax=Naasia sp. SYSU D00948 TaxID=2817379 RepID=UPI001B309FDD|nr:pyridoxamine 5'-phosphate oxidase family protein [Naasia sp. SYSU D00948]
MDTAPEASGPKPVVELTEDECWDFLRSQELGRLAVSVAGVPDIFPVNFVTDARTVLFRTAHGTKLLELAVNQYVAFEADRWNIAEGTSVVIRGRASILESAEELDEAARRELSPWVPGAKPVFVRIQPATITGRRLRLRTDRSS